MIRNISPKEDYETLLKGCCEMQKLSQVGNGWSIFSSYLSNDDSDSYARSCQKTKKYLSKVKPDQTYIRV